MTENSTVHSNKVNKSKLILDALREMGLDTPANDIIDTLKKDGVDVKVGLVNNIRSKMRRKKEDRKARRAKQPVEPVAEEESEYTKLLAVKRLAEEVGGLNQLKVLVDKLSALVF